MHTSKYIPLVCETIWAKLPALAKQSALKARKMVKAAYVCVGKWPPTELPYPKPCSQILKNKPAFATKPLNLTSLPPNIQTSMIRNTLFALAVLTAAGTTTVLAQKKIDPPATAATAAPGKAQSQQPAAEKHVKPSPSMQAEGPSSTLQGDDGMAGAHIIPAEKAAKAAPKPAQTVAPKAISRPKN